MANHDYTRRGFYLITTVVRTRAPVLSEVRNGQVTLLPAGQHVADALGEVPKRFATVAIDCFVVMPNHVHVIVRLGIGNSVHLGRIAGTFKGLSARAINVLFQTKRPFWQRGYHDQIIRNASALEAARRYVTANPRRMHHTS